MGDLPMQKPPNWCIAVPSGIIVQDYRLRPAGYEHPPTAHTQKMNL